MIRRVASLNASVRRIPARTFAANDADKETLSSAIKALGGNPFQVSLSPAKRIVDEHEILRLAELPLKDIFANKPEVVREVGNAFSNGVVVNRDYEKAVELWRSAAERGDQNSQHSLAIALLQGVGVPSAKPEQGKQMLEDLAAEGHAFAQFSLAKVLADPILAQVTDTELMKGEEEEDQSGNLVRFRDDPSAVRAVALYKAASKGGVVPALNNVAHLFATGVGCKRDDAYARKIYEAAAEMGDPHGAFTLATWCNSGRGNEADEEDLVQGFRWHSSAAKAGLAKAQFNTGVHFMTGKGVPAKDYDKAAEWFQLAAERGMAEACVNLGELHRMGLGGSGRTRPAEAKHWHRRAVELGSHFAADLLEDDRNFEEGAVGALPALTETDKRDGAGPFVK